MNFLAKLSRACF